MNDQLTDIRPSPIAGHWYDSDPKTLSASIDEYLNMAVLPQLNGHVVGVIAPHAGHVYSGHVAGYAFSAMRGLTPELVIILSPYHNHTPHPLLVTAHEAYATPLGCLEVDRSAVKELQSLLGFKIETVTNDREHSLEIELPFLQRIFQHNYKLLPIMVRGDSHRIAYHLGKALGKLMLKKNAVLVASTDLSHFFDQRTASILDHEMLRRFEMLDSHAIFDAEARQQGFACGHAAVAAMVEAAKEAGANKVQTVKYATSGDISKDFNSVVGYAAAVVLKQI